jgi:FimV-like protein
MMMRRSITALLLACAAAVAMPGQAQVAQTYEVRRGDTLFAIARKTKPEGVTRNQMILAIWQANRGVFTGGNINLLEVGTSLMIPGRDVVAALDSTDADRQVRELLASYPASSVTRTEASGGVPVAPARGLEQAARRYQEGLNLERQGDDRAALAAFLESGEAGYGNAQRKLGQIYDKGNSAVKRDLQASILWYQKARSQGVALDKPVPRVVPKWSSD